MYIKIKVINSNNTHSHHHYYHSHQTALRVSSTMSVNRFTRGKLQFILGLSLGVTASFFLTSYVQLTTTRVHVPLDMHELPAFRQLGQQGALQQARELDEHELHELMEHGDAAAAGQGAKAVHFEDVHVHHGECVCVCRERERVRAYVRV